MKNKTFYVSTPIYYPSNKLHIGHALTTTMADTMARYKKMLGYDVFFLTGSDEHGQKIEKTALAAGMTPLEYTDGIVAHFQELWEKLNIQYNDFIRTTEKRHYDTVATLFQKIYDKGDIYKSEYEGFYCTPCESFYTERQLVDGTCPDCGRTVDVVKEESYFFKMAKYQDRLIEYIESHPNFVQPITRRNEMLSFLKQGLEDLCVSRTTFDWGIPVPIDDDHVIYVWFDALTNYITALDYLNNGENYQKFWVESDEVVHLLAKDIVRFHAIIWPIMLMAADIELPSTVFAHGWLLLDGGKMSKSKGNVVDPMELIAKYGPDPIRYFLLREMPYGEDGYYSEEALILRTNTDLANDYGNLLSRTTSMLDKFFEGVVPSSGDREPIDDELAAMGAELKTSYVRYMEKFEFGRALQEIWKLISRANKYIEETAPWSLAKDESTRSRLRTVIYNLVETIRVSTILIEPFMPETPNKVWEQLGLQDDQMKTWDSITFGTLNSGFKISRGEPIFPRIDPEEALKESLKKAEEAKESAETVKEEGANLIGIEDFFRSDLRVGKVLSAEKVEGADKLLKLSVEVGHENRIIVAGIAQHYTPEQLTGKSIVVVANLKPVKLRGIMSQGMLLAATSPDKKLLSLVTVDGDMPSGSKVG